MIFEEFLKDIRKQKKITQGQLAEMVFTSHQNISSYERLRTECSFDMGMTLLNALGVSVIIENNQIIIKDGIKDMKKSYVKENLSFMNFDPSKVKHDIRNKIQDEQYDNSRRIKEAKKELENNGFKVKILNKLTNEKSDANCYGNNDELVSVSKNGRELTLICSGWSSITHFLLEDFISDIANEYPEEAKFIEKAIIFTVTNSNSGNDLYEAFKEKDELKILELMPMIEDMSKIIIKYLENGNYFRTTENGFNPKDITISEHLRIYNCTSSRYPYYAFTMPTGEKVIADEPFEGDDVIEAMECAFLYFKDYDRYVEEFNNFPEDFNIL